MSLTAALVLILGTILLYLMLRSGENLRFETSADPHRVVMAAVGIVGAKRGWQPMAQSDHGVSFRYYRQPKALVALILLLILLIPGIVYLVLARKRESLVLAIDSTTAGVTVVQVTSNGYRGKLAGRELRRQMALAAGALGAHGAAALTRGV